MSAGSVAGLGFLHRSSQSKLAPLRIKLWVTEEAAAYPDCRRRSVEYLRAALAPIRSDVAFSFGRRPVAASGDDRHVERIQWPREVLAGAAGMGAVDPVADVNLLLTDGSVTDSSVGYAYDHIAAVPGAHYIESMPPAESTPTVVEYSASAAVTQLLLHEVGHALGLSHHHGSVAVTSSSVTVSPMVSGYAWASAAVRETELPTQTCTAPPTQPSPHPAPTADIPAGSADRTDTALADDASTAREATDDRTRQLSLKYAPCAERAVRDYAGRGLL